MSFVALPLEVAVQTWPVLADVLKTTCLTGGGNSLQTEDISVIEDPVGAAAVAWACKVEEGPFVSMRAGVRASVF